MTVLSNAIKTTLTLAPTGQKMPIVGYGMWKVPNDKCKDQVIASFKAGYRLLDNAADYGNEKEVGDGIVAAIEQGIVKREDIFITSKLWNTNHHPSHVREACLRSIKDLQSGPLDLYLIHFPIPLTYVDPATRYPPAWGDNSVEKVSLRDTWEAMEKLVEEGLVKNIGISNMSAVLIMDLLKYAKIRPAALQVEIHPYLSQELLVQFAQKEGIAVTAYSSFGAQSYVELGIDHAISCKPLLEHDVIKTIAKKSGKTTAQVLLRWAVQRGMAVIPKSSDPVRLAANYDVTSFELTEEQMKEIGSLNSNIRFNDPGLYFGIPIFA